MKFIACIPARYHATRFPFKLMQTIADKSIIRHTYDNTVATGLFDEVLVITDHEIIYNEIKNHGGSVVMSTKKHESGSDRIAEAIENIEADVIINVQGDEPFVERKPLEDLKKVFINSSVSVASLMKRITDAAAITNPNIVKLVCDNKNNALYFSRSVIPYNRSENEALYWEHIGIYAYRKEALLAFTKWTASSLEKVEMLEQLRYLENGVKIQMVETDINMIKIDVPEDLELAREHYKKSGV